MKRINIPLPDTLAAKLKADAQRNLRAVGKQIVVILTAHYSNQPAKAKKEAA